MSAFRRQKIGMGQKGVFFHCRGRARYLQDLRNQPYPECAISNSFYLQNWVWERHRKYPNRTVNHKNLLPWVQSHAHWGRFSTGIHNQGVKLSEVTPESIFYLQPTNTRSAEFTLVTEEANGVQWEAALEERAAEKSWWGCKSCLGLE